MALELCAPFHEGLVHECEAREERCDPAGTAACDEAVEGDGLAGAACGDEQRPVCVLEVAEDAVTGASLVRAKMTARRSAGGVHMSRVRGALEKRCRLHEPHMRGPVIFLDQWRKTLSRSERERLTWSATSRGSHAQVTHRRLTMGVPSSRGWRA